MTDELLMKFLLKESTIEENKKVADWLQANEANKKHFAQLETIWKLSHTLKNEQKRDEEQAWNAFKVRRESIKTTRPLKIYATWLKIAAVLVLAVGGWLAYSLYGTKPYTELSTSAKVRTENLPDGSALTLNKNSTISYAGNFKENRKLKMGSGDVFFEVAKDKVHPFVIQVDRVNIEVVGTSFNIKHLKNNTEIIVETGIVKVNLGNDEIKLYKNERITINGTNAKLKKEPSTDLLYNYYRTSLFQAENISLSKLVSALNEAYGSNIVVDEAAKNLTINTTLKLGSLAANLQIICDTLNLKRSTKGSTILLSL